MSLHAIASFAAAQSLTVTYRGSVNLATSTIDQNGMPFTVTGLSGLTWTGGTEYLAVMDNSNKLVKLSIHLNADGSIASAVITGGISIAPTRDFEGIAYTSFTRDSVFLSEEGTPAILEINLADGGVLQSPATPPVFLNRRSNFGFESMTRRPDGSELWTANEEALTVDGPISTPGNGTVVRLLRYGLSASLATPAQQFAYLTEPMHGSNITGGVSGLSDMVELPNGRLLTLERSLALSALGLFQSRIYELDFTGATDVSGMTAGLIGQSYVTVTKHLLWSASLTNMEGLALGPPLSGCCHALLGIVDDGDPLSVNTLVAFELSGDIDPACDAALRCDANCDGSVNQFDIQPFVQLLSPQHPAPCSPCAGDANADGSINQFDIQGFVNCLTGP